MTVFVEFKQYSFFENIWSDVDCGIPKNITGASYTYINPGTTFGSSFRFDCKLLYDRIGKSEQDDEIVHCRSEGYWDFGSLQCTGELMMIIFFLYCSVCFVEMEMQL